MREPDLREEKLPQWAQRTLNSLRMRLEATEARLTIGSDGARAFLDPYSDAPQPLGENPHVAFYPVAGKSDYISVRFETHNEGGERLRIIASSGTMRVEPQSSNVIAIDIRDPRFLPPGTHYKSNTS